jgi:FkbM family methyltransferase
MSLREGFEHHFTRLGVRGVLAISAYRLLGVPRLIRATYNDRPIWLRLGTTDLSVFCQVLMSDAYRFGLPEHADVILDAGANIGLASIFYARQFPHARIVAIEPDRSNFEALLRNTAPYTNIEPINAALWSHDGTVEIVSSGHGEWGLTTREGPGVRAISMPTLLRECGIANVDLLKCDIEGAESEVFRSREWLDSVKAVVIELHDQFSPDSSSVVKRAMAAFASAEDGELTWFHRC